MIERDPKIMPTPRLVTEQSPGKEQDIAATALAVMDALEKHCLPRHGLPVALNVLISAFVNLGLSRGVPPELLRQMLENTAAQVEVAAAARELLKAKAANTPETAA